MGLKRIVSPNKKKNIDGRYGKMQVLTQHVYGISALNIWGEFIIAQKYNLTKALILISFHGRERPIVRLSRQPMNTQRKVAPGIAVSFQPSDCSTYQFPYKSVAPAVGVWTQQEASKTASTLARASPGIPIFEHTSPSSCTGHSLPYHLSTFYQRLGKDELPLPHGRQSRWCHDSP